MVQLRWKLHRNELWLSHKSLKGGFIWNYALNYLDLEALSRKGFKIIGWWIIEVSFYCAEFGVIVESY